MRERLGNRTKWRTMRVETVCLGGKSCSACRFRGKQPMSLRRRVFALVAAGLLPLSVASQAEGLGYAHPAVVSADPVNTTPHVLDGTVRAIAAVGSRVYVGGTFTTVVNAGTSSRLVSQLPVRLRSRHRENHPRLHACGERRCGVHCPGARR